MRSAVTFMVELGLRAALHRGQGDGVNVIGAVSGGAGVRGWPSQEPGGSVKIGL